MPPDIPSARDNPAPWHPFRFRVGFVREPIDGRGGGAAADAEDICEGAFSEVTGLEACMEPRTIREGGSNYGAHQRAGHVSFATVVLKRGMTATRDLWKWWAVFAGGESAGDGNAAGGAYAHRMTVRITLMDMAGTAVLRWRLERAMPVKFKAADFNARASEVAIEELHLAHEGLFFETP
jgi:phage tail-like protein